MSTHPPIRCEQFDEQADELALGLVEEPLRSRLLAHAGECHTCQSLLDGLGTVVDRLLLVAPQEEPPAGFESRALARIGTPAAAARQRFRVPLWAAAVVALLVGVTGFGVARLLSDRSPATEPSAAIVSATGVEVGTVHLVSAPAPHVLVTVHSPRPGSEVRNCELQQPDGTWVNVGSWKVSDLASGVWAVGIDASLLDSTAMRVTADDGTVLASAEF